MASRCRSASWARSTSAGPSAAHLVGLLKQVQPQGPYRLAGWSFGGSLAYEVATCLEASGEVVEFLGLVDARLPTGPVDGAPEASGIEVVISLAAGDLEEIERARAALGHLPADASFEDQLDALKARAGDLFPAQAATVRQFDVQEVRRWLLHWRSNVRAMHGAAHQPIKASLNLFAVAPSAAAFGPWLEWDALLPRSQIVSTRMPGAHHDVVLEPHMRGPSLGFQPFEALAHLLYRQEKSTWGFRQVLILCTESGKRDCLSG